MYNHDARWANLKTTSVLVMIFTDKIFAEYLFVDMGMQSFARPTAMASQLLPRQKNRVGWFSKVVNFEQTANCQLAHRVT